MQYFAVQLPTLPGGTKIEYAVVVRSPGRQVTSLADPGWFSALIYGRRICLRCSSLETDPASLCQVSLSATSKVFGAVGGDGRDKGQRKFAAHIESKMTPSVRRVLYFQNSREIVNFLEKLTGVKGMIPDPHSAGGGCHELRPGGFLKVHADFNWHKQMRLDRQIDLLVYLNKDWQPKYGGNLKGWNRQCAIRLRNMLPCLIVA
jgi:hypothetical protein